MPKCQRPNPRRRDGALTAPANPLEAIAFAVAALQMALAQATPKDAPAIARQLVAAAKEWEQALDRQRARAQDAARAAAEEKKEREIGEMAAALDAAFPDWKPWGDCDVRYVAETLREEGLMDGVLTLPPEPCAPPGYWDGIRPAPAGRDDAPQNAAAPEPPEEDFDWDGFDAELAALSDQDEAGDAAPAPAGEDPPPPGPRVRVP